MKSQKNRKDKKVSKKSKLFMTFLPSFFILSILVVSFFGLSFNISEAAGIVPCNPQYSDGTSSLTDPCGWEQLVKLGQNILDYAIVLMAILSVVGIAYAGFLYLSSGGDGGKIKKAHGIFAKIIWGIIFVLGAYLIVKTLLTGLGYGQNGFESFLI